MGIPRSSSPSSSSCSSSSSSPSSHSSPSSLSSCFSSSSLSNSTPPARCEGLDLLVKAVYCVASRSAVGVPYIQRRVIRRRKRAIRFSHLIITETKKRGGDGGQIDEDLEGKRQTKTRKEKLAMPSKYNDSIFRNWKPPRGRRSRSGSGLSGFL